MLIGSASASRRLRGLLNALSARRETVQGWWSVVGLALMLVWSATAAAQAPQSWTATGYPDRVFPSEPAALAAIHALGGKYKLAEVVQYVSMSSSGETVTYIYQAKPRPPETGAWYYWGSNSASPSYSEELETANILAFYQDTYPVCGFQSIEVEEPWSLYQSAYLVPKTYTRILRLEATNPNQCTRFWYPQQWKSRDVGCPQYTAWNSRECILENVAATSSSAIPCDECGLRGNPVRVVNGGKIQRENDLSLGWMDFYRTLNTAYQTEGGAGRYWTHNYNMRRYGEVSSYGAVSYPDGRLVSFFSGEAIDGSGATLRTDGGDVVLSQSDGLYRFNASGRLYRIERFAGDVLSIEFDDRNRISSISHSTGRSVDFGYADAVGVGESELAFIKDQDGPLVTYAYDDEARLVLATYRDGSARRYLYENPTYRYALTGILDEAGNRYASYSYNNDALAIASEHAGGAQKATFDYQSDGDVVHTNALGAVERIKFSPAAPYRKITAITTQQGVESWQYELPSGSGGDFRRRVVSHTHRSGRVDRYSYQEVSDPVVGGIRIERKTVASNLPESVSTEVWRRRDTNQIVRRVGTARTQTWLHNARGQVVRESVITSAGESRITSYTYCDQVDVQAGCPLIGLLRSVDGPMPGSGDTTSYFYYPDDDPACISSVANCSYRKGDLWKIVQPLGHVTEFISYDGGGRPHVTLDPNGIVTEYRYTLRGWVASVTLRGSDDPVSLDDRVTTMEYYPTGLVSRVIAPDGSVAAYTYDDAQRLTGVSDSAGNSIRYTLDALGNKEKEEYKGAGGEVSRTLSRVFNGLGQLVTSGDGFANLTGYEYDVEGNQISTTSPLGRVTRREYDALRRLKRMVRDANGIAAETGFSYDSEGSLTQVIDPKGLATNYVYNGLGDPIAQSSPDTGSENYTVDDSGNRLTRTDARGITVAYQYDALGRVTHTTYPDPSLNVVTVYDVAPSVCAPDEQFPRGRTGTVIHAGGRTEYCYDRFGQVARKVQTINGVSRIVRFAYNKSGGLSRLTYPDGSVADYRFDSVGRAVEVGLTRPGRARQIVISNVTYAPFGPVTGWSYGDGRRLDRQVDADYRVIRVHDSAPGGLSISFGYDPEGNIVDIKDGVGLGSLVQYEYDSLGRLTETQDGPTAAAIERYAYDATGNRTELMAGGSVVAYDYENSSHRLVSVQGEERAYDAAGNTTIIGGREFSYGDSNRLSSFRESGSLVEEYLYNHRGERTAWLSGDGGAKVAVYDEDGRRIGGYENLGASSEEIVWMGDFPLAVFSGESEGARLGFIQPDHLGTPRVVLDSDLDRVVWEWNVKSEAFGNQSPNLDPDGDGEIFDLGLRFPGQLASANGYLIYNYYRDYEPSTGRYAQSDPLGLAGGASTYSYAEGAPTQASDPLGLKAVRKEPLGPTERAPDGTIYCDGGVVTPYVSWWRLSSHERECWGDCLTVHENSHVIDATNSNPGVCRYGGWLPLLHPVGQVKFDNDPERLASEYRAYAAELRCLVARLNDEYYCRDGRCLAAIRSRINDIIVEIIPKIRNGTYGIH